MCVAGDGDGCRGESHGLTEAGTDLALHQQVVGGGSGTEDLTVLCGREGRHEGLEPLGQVVDFVFGGAEGPTKD